MMNLTDELKGIKSVAVSGHIRPDGDCVGSTMAVYLYLRKNMPDIDTHIYLEKPADIFDVIKDIDKIEPAEDVNREFDAFICIDCSKDRLGAAEKIFDKAKKASKGDIIMTDTSENVEDICKSVAYLGEEDVAVSNHALILKHKQNPKFLSYSTLTKSFFRFMA